MKRKLAFFRFEASPEIGAGHAVRSSVILDTLVSRGWDCHIVTSLETIDFIPMLEKYSHVLPDKFEHNPIDCDLFVIDHYHLDVSYEKKFRKYAKKILVIDDLADRKHMCDILLDQTVDRDCKEYNNLVSHQCKVLTGNHYALVKKDFCLLRPKALIKRRNTKKIDRILISVGGADSDDSTLKILQEVNDAKFKGTLDVVLGFSDEKASKIRQYAEKITNEYSIYTDADMPKLTYLADCVLGSAGSSIWERLCLGTPQKTFLRADNQKNNHNFIEQIHGAHSVKDFLQTCSFEPYLNLVDGFGVNRLLSEAENPTSHPIYLESVDNSDIEMIYHWQQLKDIRKYFYNAQAPSEEEHHQWFSNRMQQIENPYWKIYFNNQPCGIISLVYSSVLSGYEVSWFVHPDYQNKGIGTKALKMAMDLVSPFRVLASVKQENIYSKKVFEKLLFQKRNDECYVLRN